jgi:hypothetical protein
MMQVGIMPWMECITIVGICAMIIVEVCTPRD